MVQAGKAMPRKRIRRGTTVAERRAWIIESRQRHELTREQAERLVAWALAAKGRVVHNSARVHAVEHRLDKAGLSQEELAYLAGCSQNEISKIELGLRERMDPELVDAIGRELRMTREQVMFGGQQPRIVRILGEMDGDGAIRAYPEEERLEIAHIGPESGLIGYRVAGNGLAPRFRPGELLICSPDSASLEDCYDRDCIVEFGGERFVRIVKRGATPRIVSLMPYHHGTPLDQIDIQPEWCSPVLYIKTAPTTA